MPKRAKEIRCQEQTAVLNTWAEGGGALLEVHACRDAKQIKQGRRDVDMRGWVIDGNGSRNDPGDVGKHGHTHGYVLDLGKIARAGGGRLACRRANRGQDRTTARSWLPRRSESHCSLFAWPVQTVGPCAETRA